MGDEIKLRASTGCPKCGQRHVIDLVYGLIAKELGDFSLSGNQMKVSAVEGWFYRCTECGGTGRVQAPVFAAEALRGVPPESCGHIDATGHHPIEAHDLGMCPGCCGPCTRYHDELRKSR